MELIQSATVATAHAEAVVKQAAAMATTQANGHAEEVPEPLFDHGSYPAEETLARIRSWDGDIEPLLRLAADAWSEHGVVTEELTAQEKALVRAEEGDRFLRFVTGGWSGNEALLAALDQNWLATSLTWRVSTAGGLHIYRIPPKRPT